MQLDSYQIQAIKDQARADVRALLAGSLSFKTMDRAEQMNLYQDLYKSAYNRLAGQKSLSKGMATPKEPQKASDLIDDSRHKNSRIDQAGDIAKNFMDGVDFPKFVRDLVKGVYDANLEVTIKQMDEYIKLMKAATASISKFVNQVDDAAAFGYLAENEGDSFSLGFDDEKKEQTLTDKEGNKLDLGDNEIKAKIMDAKIKMAQEQRALLRETILMGVTRLVVERGEINASVLFDIKANEQVIKQDKAAKKDASSTTSSFHAGGGFIGKIFGGPDGGVTNSQQHSTISISSAKSTADTQLQAKVTGSVKLVFKSDYFALNNFASMYGQIQGESGGAQAGAPRPAAPAPTAGTPALPAR
jgi:hypothetical protein